MMTKQAELKKQAYASTLKSRALSVLIYLIDRSNQELTCFPAIPTMAEQLHISVSTVKRALHELLDSGYIKKDARFREKNKGQTSNLYTLVLLEGGTVPDGSDSSGGCAKEGEVAEAKQESTDEAGQERCQTGYISFETLKKQKEARERWKAEERPQTEEQPQAKEQPRAETQPQTDAICVEECPETQQENQTCGSFTLVKNTKSFLIVRNVRKDFHLSQQDKEKALQAGAFTDRYYLICLYLWTGAGFSLMPP